MSAWTVVGAIAVAVCALTRARSLRGAVHPRVYAPLGSLRATVCRGLLVTAGAGLVAGTAWTLLALDEHSSPLRALDVILVAAAVRGLVRGWRESQARMIWSGVAEDADRGPRAPRTP